MPVTRAGENTAMTALLTGDTIRVSLHTANDATTSNEVTLNTTTGAPGYSQKTVTFNVQTNGNPCTNNDALTFDRTLGSGGNVTVRSVGIWKGDSLVWSAKLASSFTWQNNQSITFAIGAISLNMTNVA
jgi:hypothetical protein